VAAHRGVISSIPAPGPPIDVKSVRGKSIWYIPLGASIPVLQGEAQGIQQAARALGMSYSTCDGKLLPAQWAACINEAVNAGAAGIILDSIAPAAVSTALANAKSHNIPVVDGNELNGNTPLFQTMDIGGDFHDQPVAMDWIIARSDGKAHVLVSQVIGDPAANSEVTGSVAELKKNCPQCVSYTITVTPETVPDIKSAASTAMLRNPGVTYGFPEFDFFEPLFASGIQTSGHKITIVSTDNALSDMQEIKAGTGQVADAGGNRNYLGWAAVDRLLRMILHKPAPVSITVPVRIFDSTNIGTIQLTQAAALSGQWYGPTTYQQQFLRLWGVA
jgi:ribose transport system substrate-binding protein